MSNVDIFSAINCTAPAAASSRSPAAIIFTDVARAIRALHLRGAQLSRAPLPLEDVRLLLGMTTRYHRSLTRIARLKLGVKQRSMSEQLIFNAFAAKVSACVRALDARFDIPDLRRIVSMAKKLDVRTPLAEPVRAWWEPKDRGFRLICSDGPMRTAQRLLLRDALMLMGVDSEYDVTRRGGGGEGAFMKTVTDAMGNGYTWWATPDVRNCFPSLKPAHFGWLPIDRRLLLNVAFLPRCAKVEVIMPDDPAAVMAAVCDAPPPYVAPYAELLMCTVAQVRHGLPQGSVISPLLARGLIGRELRASLGELGIVTASYVDDVAIGARTREGAQAAVEAFKSRLRSHPAGPVHLHSADPIHIDSREVTVLGYRLDPQSGHGTHAIHVKPGPKRTERFKRRLSDRLRKAGPTEDLLEVGLTYWARWFTSQQAWTKVPGYSRQLSENIALSYIEDFRMGVPMGASWQKPRLGCD